MLAKALIRGMHLASVALLGISIVSTAHAGNFGGVRTAVGGISIDASGALKQAAEDATAKLKKFQEEQLADINQDLVQATQIRKVSLRQLERILTESAEKDVDRLPDEIKYLAGIQRIQYVLVYPEENDIVLAGPGEGWKINQQGDVVGQTTGRPVILLEDLIVALKSVDAARLGGISVSIDPTPEGRRSMNAFVKRQNRFSPQVLKGIAQALGPQQISITGVPETSHFSRVLVAADYRMKRIAMHLEDSPVQGLESYLTILKKKRARVSDMMPRWWLASDYEPLARSQDGLAWELRGQGVKAMTEDEMVLADGTVRGTGTTNPIAQKWADSMTAHFDQLCQKESIFGQLRNIMDMCVVAALIQKEGMFEKAHLHAPNLTGQSDEVILHTFNPPKTVEPQCSFIKQGKNYIITASGGIMIESWQAATRSQTSQHVGDLYKSIKHETSDSIWWN